MRSTFELTLIPDQAKPFIKWVGGKRQLLHEIKPNLPQEFNTYFEPFIGGGALFFDLNPKQAIINDYNIELVNVYETIKSNPQALIDDLRKHKNTEDYYYAIRGLDRDVEAFASLTQIERASRFIYLNKTGFNGLYRVNNKNQINVAFGGYDDPCILDESNLIACHHALQSTTILQGDFENIRGLIQKGDFVYLDPPYAPLTQTANFVSYTAQGFGHEKQIKVKNLCDYIDSIGAYFMLSNSSASIIFDLYKDYNLRLVDANRKINVACDKRGAVKEVLVTNY